MTEVVAGGVEAVINFFRDRGPKLLVQQEGVSLVNEEADAPGKPVTHCHSAFKYYDNSILEAVSQLFWKEHIILFMRNRCQMGSRSI